MLDNIRDVLDLGKTNNPHTVAVVCAHDEEVIKAVASSLSYNINAILIGKENSVRIILNDLGIDSKQFKIINASSDEDAASIGVKLVRDGNADLLMKGLLDTKVLLKAVVNKETGIRELPLLSHVMMASVPLYHKVLFASDCAMVINPSVDEKVELINNAISVTNTLGYKKPKVGIVSAVEKVNPKMQSTIDAVELINRSKDGEVKECYLDGPFAIDNLISKEAAVHKGIKSLVAGDVDILLFPNIEAGNVFYKTIVFLANAIVSGIIVGAKCPIILTSRADSSESKLYSIILAAVYANEKNLDN